MSEHAMPERALVVTFEEERSLVDAVRELRRRGYSIVDVHSPYAIHSLEEAAGFDGTRLGWVCAGAGFSGAALMLLFQWWTSAIDWAVNVGGKPYNSLPAFIPAVFEIGVLFAGLTTVAAFFLRSRLYPGRRAVLPATGVTNDRFAIVLEETDGSFDSAAVRQLCDGFGATGSLELVDGRTV